MAALHDVHNNVSLTKQFPHENCTDFVCKAAYHMAAKDHIKGSEAERVFQLHNDHADAVRSRTNTAYNREGAGV
jgi:hypothetical protein